MAVGGKSMRGTLLKLNWNLLFLMLVLPATLEAHRECSDALGELTLPKIRLANSGRDMDLQNDLQRAAEIIYQEIAPKLGLKIPDMVIKSLSANDMAALTANSGHPAPHWHDGQQVMASAKRAGNILEFVETGRDSHVQYVRDVNTFLETLIVYAHVVGHYDFAETSYLFQVRDGDRIRDSYELSTYMSVLYGSFDAEEVDQFYQWMLSTKFLQDTGRGSFVSPEQFKTQRGSRTRRYEPASDPLSVSRTEVEIEDHRHPKAPSRSVLQSLVENLSPTAGEYKPELIKKFERLHRVFPAIMLTKIMNEGWATLMEYIILAHSPWNTGENMLDFAAINAQVNVASLSNPYWLGLNAWLRIRERFIESQGLKDADAFEQDRQFIAYARDIIARYTDYEFLMMAFDDKWVEEHKLYLYRKATPEETGSGAWGPEKNVAVTRNTRRVVKHIADKVANFESKIPQFQIVDFNDDDSGAVRIQHTPIHGVPLKRSSMGKAAYVLSKILERPVILETIGTNLWFKSGANSGMRDPGALPPANYEYALDVRVTPRGEVSVSYDEADENIRFPGNLAARLEEQIRLYQQDLDFTYPSLEKSDEMEGLIALALESQSAPVGELANVVGHGPTASHAVFKYQQLMKRRANEVFYRAAQGKWPIKYSGDGQRVRIRLLPEIPQFELDDGVEKKLRDFIPPTPIANSRPSNWELHNTDLTQALSLTGELDSTKVFFDRDLDLGQGSAQPGDMWDRPPEEDGEGGDGESDESEESDQESDEPGDEAGTEPGDPKNDSSTIEIPVEIFAQMIADQFQLRNLRKLQNGKNRLDQTRRGASIQNPEGVLNDERTAENDIANGVAILESEGKNPDDYSIDEIYIIGLKHRTPSDHIVASRIVTFKPDMDAVILYVADTSGSMGEEHRKVERKMVAYISAVLKSVYPHLEERFVIYDTEALEVERDEFFTRFQGGGTSTVAGLEVASKILEEYPRDRFNRYMHLFSDGGDGAPEKAVNFVRELLQEIEYFGYAHIEPSGSWSGRGAMSDAFGALAEELKDVAGFAELNETHESLMEGLQNFYGKQNR